MAKTLETDSKAKGLVLRLPSRVGVGTYSLLLDAHPQHPLGPYGMTLC